VTMNKATETIARVQPLLTVRFMSASLLIDLFID
jgi:hypothetical protein